MVFMTGLAQFSCIWSQWGRRGLALVAHKWPRMSSLFPQSRTCARKPELIKEKWKEKQRDQPDDPGLWGGNRSLGSPQWSVRVCGQQELFQQGNSNPCWSSDPLLVTQGCLILSVVYPHYSCVISVQTSVATSDAWANNPHYYRAWWHHVLLQPKVGAWNPEVLTGFLEAPEVSGTHLGVSALMVGQPVGFRVGKRKREDNCDIPNFL